MNRFRIMVFAVAILASAGCAGDGATRKTSSSASPTVTGSAPAAKSEKAVALSCSVERAVGTNIPKKTCMTAQQREVARKQASESVKDMQRGGGSGNRESGL